MQELHIRRCPPPTIPPGEAGAQHRRQLARNPGRHRPGQAPGRRGRAPLRARAPAGRHHRRRGGRADLGPQRAHPDPGQRRPGGAARALLRPLPGDPIIAGMRMGHGLVVHTADCPVAMRQPARTGTLDQCGLGHAHGQAPRHPPGHRHAQRARRAGRLAAEVTAADANIVHVTMHDDAVATVSLHLTIQVDSRKHLAQVIRAIRHVPQVQKIVRVRGDPPRSAARFLRGMSTDRRSRIRDIPIWGTCSCGGLFSIAHRFL